MTAPDHYMLPRDHSESQRLDAGHEFYKAMYGGQLIHPSIRKERIHRVADIGTGTGTWLRDVAESLAEPTSGTHVGFDISSEQFPPVGSFPNSYEFVVHDMTKPFPGVYHEQFDLVHLRFMTYGLQQADILATLKNVASLVKPGRYIQWQEVDITDCWATPATENVRQAVRSIVREKAERGLMLSTPSKIIEMMLSLKVDDGSFDGNPVQYTETSRINPVTWTDQLLRIITVETMSTEDHPSSQVQSAKEAIGIAVNTKLLRSGAERKKMLSLAPDTPADQAESLSKEAQELEDLASGIERDYQAKAHSMDAEVIRIVARKAVLVSLNEDWMTANHR